MSYSSKKTDLLSKSSKLLKSYRTFYKDVSNFSNYLKSIIDNSADFSALDQLDLANLVSSDEGMKKLDRLICALDFVEKPEDKSIAFRLQDKIDESISQKYIK
ncbi:MAG: hypothetical protein HFI86_08195 [Bacilli bacterium]|nr:hypothetical protein [Bacilli bacterium]MCI9435230.1 hypothetical protein [Bacilli bacterium]